MNHLKTSGIYKIEHTASGRVYVGSAVSIHIRWNAHRSRLQRHRHENKLLQNAWIKYGGDSFVFSVLELVPDKLLLIQREQHWINALNAAKRPNFNLNKIAESGFGFVHSDEARAKISAANKGRPPHNKGIKGIPKSPETRTKMSESKKGKRLSLETRTKISISHKGLTQSAETIKKRLSTIANNKLLKQAAFN